MTMKTLAALAVSLAIVATGCAAGGSASTTAPGPVFAVVGHVHAGPTCPVVQLPPDPACDDRPVAGAVIDVADASGAVVAEAVTAQDGTFSVLLAAGEYTLIPQPVEGLLGTAAEQALTVDGPVDGLDLAYDTGIR